jgi:hypothetical protein
MQVGVHVCSDVIDSGAVEVGFEGLDGSGVRRRKVVSGWRTGSCCEVDILTCFLCLGDGWLMRGVSEWSWLMSRARYLGDVDRVASGVVIREGRQEVLGIIRRLCELI